MTRLHKAVSVDCAHGRCHLCRWDRDPCQHDCHVLGAAEVANSSPDEDADARIAPPPSDVARTEPATGEGFGAADAPCDTEREGRVVPLRGNTPGDAAAQGTQLRRTGSTP